MFRWLASLWRKPDLSSILVAAVLSVGAILLPERAKLGLAQRTVPVLFFPFSRTASFLAELARLHRENRELRELAARSTTEIERLRAQEAENAFWRRTYGLQARGRFRFVACDILAKASGMAVSTMLLNKGAREGLVKGQPVIAPEGLIGKVVSVGPSSAFVRTILDTTLHVGAMISRTRRAGILEWDRGTSHCLFTKIPVAEDAVLGDEVVTSGLGGIFPVGIPIGRVAKVGREPVGFFLDVEVVPFADLGKLSSALVLVGEDSTALPSTDSLRVSVVRVKMDSVGDAPSRPRRRDVLSGEGALPPSPPLETNDTLPKGQAP